MLSVRSCPEWCTIHVSLPSSLCDSIALCGDQLCVSCSLTRQTLMFVINQYHVQYVLPTIWPTAKRIVIVKLLSSLYSPTPFIHVCQHHNSKVMLAVTGRWLKLN